jgi:hypothetical protein
MKKQKSNVPNAGISSLPHKPLLKLDWCSHEAAKYAVEHWHYSRSLPTPPLVKIGVWEDNKFIGCVLFSRGASDALGSPYGLGTTEVCELTRVALTKHVSSVSRIVSIAIKLLRQQSVGVRLIVSYADPNNGHVGGIYQAGGWVYCGKTSTDAKFVDASGRTWHSRQVSKTGVKKQYGEYRRVAKIDECKKVILLGKHRYLYPLDADLRQRIQPLSKPYPKRATSIDSDATVIQTVEGGAEPTVALQ